jgi:hypothetical protein
LNRFRYSLQSIWGWISISDNSFPVFINRSICPCLSKAISRPMWVTPVLCDFWIRSEMNSRMRGCLRRVPRKTIS